MWFTSLGTRKWVDGPCPWSLCPQLLLAILSPTFLLLGVSFLVVVASPPSSSSLYPPSSSAFSSLLSCRSLRCCCTPIPSSLVSFPFIMVIRCRIPRADVGPASSSSSNPTPLSNPWPLSNPRLLSSPWPLSWLLSNPRPLSNPWPLSNMWPLSNPWSAVESRVHC